jgi:hypothetical protein
MKLVSHPSVVKETLNTDARQGLSLKHAQASDRPAEVTNQAYTTLLLQHYRYKLSRPIIGARCR